MIESVPEYADYMNAQQDGRSKFIGPSGITGCYRQHAYRYFGTQVSDEQSTDAANFGTLLHLGWSALIKAQFDPAERAPDVPIHTPGMPRSGSADDVDYVNKIVTDLKSTGAKAWQSWLDRGTPYEKFWDQLEVYASGLRYLHGGDWTLRVVAFNRETGERAEFERPADQARADVLVASAGARHEALQASLTGSGTPLDFPREGAGPGRGMPCDWCSWESVCWDAPTDPDRTSQSESLDEDSTSIGMYIADYLEALADESKAADRKKDAAVFLKGLVGEYVLPDGSTGKVSLVGGKPKDAVPDCDTMISLLEENNIPVPLKSGGATPRYTKVIRLKRGGKK